MKIFKTIRIYTEYVANLIRKDWLAHAFLHFGIVTYIATHLPLRIWFIVIPTIAWGFVASMIFGIGYEFVWDKWACEDRADWTDITANFIGGLLAWLIFVI